jgi:hypothetical protein
MRFDGLVISKTVRRGIAEAVVFLEFVVAVVGKARVLGDPVTDFDHLVEDVIERIALLCKGIGGRHPGLPTGVAIRLLQEFGHLRNGIIGVPEVNRHAAGGLLILLAEQRFVGLERHVFLPKQADIGPDRPQVDAVALRIEGKPLFGPRGTCGRAGRRTV